MMNACPFWPVTYTPDEIGWLFDFTDNLGSSVCRLGFYLLNLPTDPGVLCATVYLSDIYTDVGAWLVHSLFHEAHGDGSDIVFEEAAIAIWHQSICAPATSFGY
jgi:hypothetical protein